MPSGRCVAKAPCCFSQPGHVGVAEEGHAVGIELEGLVDGAGEMFGGLVGQAVDEVDVDAVEAEVARGLGDQSRGSFRRAGRDGWSPALAGRNPGCPGSGG